jgi:hypothetical protein
MRKIAPLLLFLTFSVSCSAEDLAPAIRACGSYSSPAEFIQVTAASKNVAKPIVRDGVSYFRPRKSLTFDGLPVLAVFAFDDNNRRLFPGASVGTQSPHMYGVSVEATEASGASLVERSAAPRTPSARLS